jgi:hypothetical protein
LEYVDSALKPRAVSDDRSLVEMREFVMRDWAGENEMKGELFVDIKRRDAPATDESIDRDLVDERGRLVRVPPPFPLAI